MPEEKSEFEIIVAPEDVGLSFKDIGLVVESFQGTGGAGVVEIVRTGTSPNIVPQGCSFSLSTS